MIEVYGMSSFNLCVNARVCVCVCVYVSKAPAVLW